ncbi:helix-turn-helix domain-containing protein [Caldimonas brevitalea]|uniref:Regulatory protein HrpB n=1 Tax=Caldimonas brevitalea TaxID=413882 RepID=A0A0G3BKD5_9BURK|nr:helix-turn-helix domain-containing protein [Caldimonas brevitalea]AKJ27821.1 regulatory protein HrpB [Caldimonas brevitalea]
MTLYVLTALARTLSSDAVLSTLLEGQIQDATARTLALIEAHAETPASQGLCELQVLAGDLMLAQGHDEEAEECYRQAVKAAASAPRGQVRVVSCRNTGFLSLYQHRFGTAAACFRRVIDDEAALTAQRTEALCALALAHHGMGQTLQALEALDEAAEQAAEAASSHLALLVGMVRVELLVQQEIRAHGSLRDHVFWQLPPTSSRQRTQIEPLTALNACLLTHGKHPLVAQRLGHLRSLLMASCGDAAAVKSLEQDVAWLRRSGIVTGERQSRIDTALVCIVVRNADMARGMLEPLCGRGLRDASSQRWNFELSYCLAKVCELTGRVDEAMQHYQRYALESVQCVRVETPAEHVSSHTPTSAAATAVKDDVEMSLPAKYRRAYRYLLEHLDSADLSIREIAEHVGVTERALQSAFRTHLGMTPIEVLRRCRVERIRRDLVSPAAPGVTVIEAAARWGIRNRSTLLSSYRKYFKETPAETLARSAGA